MPPRSRRKENVQFGVQVENITPAKKEITLPENGALIESDGKYYAGVEGQWKQFLPIDSSSLGTGWARYDDGEYTSLSPYVFTTSPFTLQNDGAVKIDNYALNMYGNNEFTLQENCTYSVTIAFKGYLNTSNGHISMYFECAGDSDYSNIADVIIFPKGNGVEHTYSRVFNFYANSKAELDGLTIKFRASHSGALYDVIYFIEKISNG